MPCLWQGPCWSNYLGAWLRALQMSQSEYNISWCQGEFLGPGMGEEPLLNPKSTGLPTLWNDSRLWGQSGIQDAAWQPLGTKQRLVLHEERVCVLFTISCLQWEEGLVREQSTVKFWSDLIAALCLGKLSMILSHDNSQKPHELARQVLLLLFWRSRKMRFQKGKGPDGWHRAEVES